MDIRCCQAFRVSTEEDRRALTALFWSNINPYGTFRLDMDSRLELPLASPARAQQPSGRGGGRGLTAR